MCSLLNESADCDSRCDAERNGTDTNSFQVDVDNCTTSLDVCSDTDNSQYVALDCEFVGVGPRQLSALGTFAM